MELGILLLKQLDHRRGDGILIEWMAQYLSKMMTSAENEKSDVKKQKLEEQIAELVLGIWQQRYALPDGLNPLDEYRNAANAVTALGAERTWYGSTKISKLGVLSIEAHHELNLSINRLILWEKKNNCDLNDEEEALLAKFLAPDELTIQHFILSMDLKKNTEDTEEETATEQPTLEDRIIEGLDKLIEGLQKIRSLINERRI